MKAKVQSYILTIVEVITVCLIIAGLFIVITSAHASDQEYQVCVNNCYLDLPNINECVADEKQYWDTGNTTEKQIRNNCKHLIKSEKVDCRINCVVSQIKFVDKAEKFYDTDVKNFPMSED